MDGEKPGFPGSCQNFPGESGRRIRKLSDERTAKPTGGMGVFSNNEGRIHQGGSGFP